MEKYVLKNLWKAFYIKEILINMSAFNFLCAKKKEFKSFQTQTIKDICKENYNEE